MLGTSGYERKERDWYPTLPEASETAFVFLDKIANGRKLTLWEPAAGDGAMLDVLATRGHDVYGTDIHPMRDDITTQNFLWDFTVPKPTDGIITNPPYGDLAQEFCERIVSHIEAGKVSFGAVLVRHEYDCGSTRAHLFDKCPYFSMKVTLTFRPRWIADSTGSPRHNYCWLVWERDVQGGPRQMYAHRRK